MTQPSLPSDAAIIGGGPAGLMAAESLATAGIRTVVFDQMPSMGRKFLMAGRGGLNLTHAEPLERLLDRYGTARLWLEPAIRAFPPDAVIAWSHGLGQETFVGSSSRVFPKVMKASPLLRAWLSRLTSLGVRFQPRHRWAGWTSEGDLLFETPRGPVRHRADATILAAGGASWPRLGSDAAWRAFLPAITAPFKPSNCGFIVNWPPRIQEQFAGHPLKRIVLRFGGKTVPGEAMISASGLEGGTIYALSADLREAILAHGSATLDIDLRPDLSLDQLAARLSIPRRGQSLSGFLRKHGGLSPEASGLIQAVRHAGGDISNLPALIKALPLTLLAPYPIARAISSAGGLRHDAIDEYFMLRNRPGVFAAGEMLDWEAPTGGYLLQACLSTGVAAARGAQRWLAITAPYCHSASHVAPATPSPPQAPSPSSASTA